MNVTRAIVLSVIGDEAIVEVESTGCGRCDEPGGCGGGKKADLFCRRRTFRVLNPLGAHAGEHVEIAIGDGAIGMAATRAYLVPLLMMLAGATLARYFADGSLGEVPVVAGAVLGLAAGWFWLQRAASTARTVAHPTIVART